MLLTAAHAYGEQHRRGLDRRQGFKGRAALVLRLELAKDAGRPLLRVRLKLDGDPSRRCAVCSIEANVCLHQ